MAKHNLSPDSLSTYRACLQECYQNGNGIVALQILEEIGNKIDFDLEAKDIQTIVLAICRNNKEDPGLWKSGLDLLTRGGTYKYRSRGKVRVEAYNAVINCMEEENEWEEAKVLLQTMESNPEIHPTPTLATYHALLQVYSAASKPDEASTLLTKLASTTDTDSTHQKPRPSGYTYELVISILVSNQYRRGEYYRAATKILDMMRSSKVPIPTVVYNRVMSACSKGRDTSMAMRLLQNMRKENVPPDTVTYNSLISANAAAGRTKDALILLKECLREPNVEPDIITFTNAIR